jgi:large subunit ribosomal protein LX
MKPLSVKIFRIEGVISKPNFTMPFLKEIRAVKLEDAVEKVYADYGSQHRVKRVHIKITSTDVISADESTDQMIQRLSKGETYAT